ncbi:glycoside hydrolase family 73 protein [Oceanirhabdus sp. W0125-5]|uniref:glycoside hydrolase family 73 protein n=1 Tax=Oceanirhabdus sp. W0125-5 TaxID=2999116 RepID=UPI0022F31816|nr:glucosaminidase domain-containing protein [Oceanirhabdus sp. W0125-5]WBW98839.1 glucosaminidase domain-containing protein [Oceanirhabdus sp. W0125-5]
MLNKPKIIETLLPYAEEVQKKFNLLPSVCIAQAILETGWLRHCSGNNIFGIKWTRNCGYDFNEIHTYEWIDGVKTPKICLFRKYKNYSESFNDYGNLLTSLRRYDPVVSAGNYKTACNELYRGGYCTDPQYPKKLISIIEENELFKYDPVKTTEEIKNANPILILQINLNKLKIPDYENKPLATDGILGPKTRSSIKHFREICCLDDSFSGEEEILVLTKIILNYNTYLFQIVRDD